MTEVEFKNKTWNEQKLFSFGFVRQGENYLYSTDFVHGQMKLTVTVSRDGKVYTQVTDNGNGEEYVLHCVVGASGSFVGQVKTEYESVLEQICAKCFDPDVFKSDQAKKVIAYAGQKYGDAPEYLWEKFPDNAVLRRKDTKKWYAALLTVSRRKLGIDSDEAVEILDLRIKPESVEELINHKQYFPGYHMNKKHWYTICLDGSVPMEEIRDRIDASYVLANTKPMG